MGLIDDLCDLQVPQSILFSPDGQKLVFATSLSFGHKAAGEDNAKTTLWHAETGKERSAKQLTSGKHNDNSAQFAPHGASIAFLSDRGKPGKSSAIHLLPFSGPGEAIALTKADSEAAVSKFEFSPDGSKIAFISADEKSEEKKKGEEEKDDADVWDEAWEYGRLRVVDVATKEITTLVERKAHVTNFAFSDDGENIVFTQTDTPDIESAGDGGVKVCIVDVNSKEIKDLTTFPSSLNFMKEMVWCGDKIYFIGPKAQTFNSANGVFQIDRTSAKTEHAHCAYGIENCAFALIKRNGDVIVKVAHGLNDEIRMLEGRTLFSSRKSVSAYDATFSKDSDEILIAVAVSDVNHPTEVFTTTASGGALIQLTDLGKKFADEKFGVCSIVSNQSFDKKVTLNCPFYTPASAPTKDDGTPSKPLPTVVLVHGGPYGRQNEAFDGYYYLWAPYLLKAGYALLLPEYRGGCGRGDEFARYADNVGAVDHDDVIAQTQAAIEKGWADKDRLIVGGWSQGGFHTFLASVKNGQHGLGWEFRAAISGAGVADWVTMTFTSDLGAWEASLIAGGAPWKSMPDHLGGRNASSIWQLNKALKDGVNLPPMLILHGQSDQRVPIEQAVAMRRALMMHKRVFEYVTYPREGHIISERKHLVDIAERVKKWCDKYIGDGKA